MWKHWPYSKVPGCSRFPPAFFAPASSSTDLQYCKMNRKISCKTVVGQEEESLLLTVSQVEVVGRAGRPQPHGVHGVVHVSGDGRVVRHRQHHLQQVGKMRENRFWGKRWNGRTGEFDAPKFEKSPEEAPSNNPALDFERFPKQACYKGPILCKSAWKMLVSNSEGYFLKWNFAALRIYLLIYGFASFLRFYQVTFLSFVKPVFAISPARIFSSSSRYLSVDPLGSILGLLHSAVEVDRQHVLGAGLLPGVSVSQPVICLFHLQPVGAAERQTKLWL